MNREPILVIADILANQMSLDPGRIFIYNQDYLMPQDKGLFIVIQFNSSTPYAVNNRFAINSDIPSENMYLQSKEEYTINVLSKDSSARLRKEEVIFALNSNYSQSLQEQYQFKIGNIPFSFLNISELEGAGMLNRFAINVNALTWYNKTNAVEYFENFSEEIIYN